MLTSAAVAHDYKNVITEASKCVSSTNNSLPHMIKKNCNLSQKCQTYYLINSANIPSFIKLYCPDSALKKGNQKL